MSSLAHSILVGAIIGAVVGPPIAVAVVYRRRRVVVSEVTSRGLVLVAIRPDWFHLGTRARFRVTVGRAGTASPSSQHVALVDSKNRVEWQPPLPD
jgi:hypothetical protein